MERFISKPSVGHTADSFVRQYDRLWWTDLADRLLESLRPYASVNNARITPPGAEGGYGNAIDGLEGFARSLMIAGFRIAGERGTGVDELIEFYFSGIAAGVDPNSPDRWVRPHEHAQAKVECASIALVLDLTRPWIWENFSEQTKAQVIDYLGELVGDNTFPRNNWLWFRIVTETFLRSVGGPWSMDDIESDLALHDSFLRSDGWISDGDERSFDFYTGWALPAVALISMWRDSGYYMILFLAGLQTIPRELYEAARVDGANFRRQFWNITLPGLRPTTFFVMVMMTIGSFKILDLVLVLTRGGPGQATLVISQFIFREGFERNNFGYASAAAVVLFLLCITVTIVQFIVNKRREA